MIGKISKLILVGFVVMGCASFASAVTAITVGQAGTGAMYEDFNTAVGAVTEVNTTIRFIDSATYDMAGQPSLTATKYEGLTIESAEGQKATINFTGTGGYCMLYGRANMTLQNVAVSNSGRDSGWLGDGNATGFVVNNVDFVNNVAGTSNYLLGASPGMEVSYSTFRGAAADSTGGPGISVYLGATDTITVDHCSFDNLGFAPIKNGSGAVLDVTNSAFGEFYGVSSYRKAMYIAGDLTEDYNVYYIQDAIAATTGTGTVTSGGNTFKVPFYTDIFIGDTGADDWTVATPLRKAASDGTTIGAWQAPAENPPFLLGDANGDGVVSAGDYAAVQANFGNTLPAEGAATPEPATLSLLAISGITLVRRKRR